MPKRTSSRRRIPVAVWVALITAGGVIAAAFLSYMGNRDQIKEKESLSATQTALSPSGIAQDYFDIIEDLRLSPISTSDGARFIFKVGETVFATVKIQNTGI